VIFGQAQTARPAPRSESKPWRSSSNWDVPSAQPAPAGPAAAGRSASVVAGAFRFQDLKGETSIVLAQWLRQAGEQAPGCHRASRLRAGSGPGRFEAEPGAHPRAALKEASLLGRLTPFKLGVEYAQPFRPPGHAFNGFGWRHAGLELVRRLP